MNSSTTAGPSRPPRRQSTGLSMSGNYAAASTWRPRYMPRLTGYRFLVISLTAGFGLTKAKLSYQGLSTAPNTLDWLYGVGAFLILYWLGIYERHAPHLMPRMFEVDYLEVFWKVVFTLLGSRQRPMPGRRPTLEPRRE